MIEDVLLNRCENSTERMLEYAGTLDPKCKPTDVKKKGAAPGAKAAGGKEKSWRDLPVEQRLTHALVKGIDEFAVRVGWLRHASCCITQAMGAFLVREVGTTGRLGCSSILHVLRNARCFVTTKGCRDPSISYSTMQHNC